MFRVKSICKQLGITHKELAEKMGVPPETVSRILSENGNPTLSTLVNMAKALDVEVYELFEDFNADKKVQGFLNIGGTIYQIHSFDDLEMLYKKINSQE